MTAHRVWTLGVFAFRSNLRMPVTRVGAGFGAGVLLLGPTISLVTGRGWAFDDTLGFYGFVIALLFCVRSGLSIQREDDLELFLVHNLVTRLAHTAGMVVSLLLTWLLVLVGTFVALTLVSGDPSLAAWHSASWGLRSAVPLGFVLVVERLSTMRLPLVLPVFGYVLAAVMATVLIGEERALELLVITDRADPGTLVPLSGQALTLLTLTLGGSLTVAWLRRPAQAVPSRHGGAPNLDP